MDETKWYGKPWFMWLMLIICWPIGAYLLYRHREKYPHKSLKYIAGITFCIWAFLGFIQPAMNSNKSIKSSTQETTQTSVSSTSSTVLSSKNSNSSSYFELSEKEIEKALNTNVAGMNLSDYWEMEHEDTGLADVKGSFDLNGEKHTFRARFISGTNEAVLLKIDDKKVFFNENRQDEVMDAHYKK